MYSVYVLINKEGQIYIGQTNNLERRIDEHNDDSKSKSRFTKNKGPWRICYKEEFLTREEATKREKFLKSHKGRDWIRSNIGALAQR